MSNIVIDAREWSSSTGRYMRNLVPKLERLDSKNKYTVLMKPADISTWEPVKPNFQKLVCPYKAFTFIEQLGFKKQLDGLQADLVHFGVTHQPVLYKGGTVTTIHDLTTIRFNNPSKNLIVFKFKQQVYKYVMKRVARKSEALITPSQFVKDDLVSFSGVSPDKIAVIYEAAGRISVVAEPIKGLEGKQFIMYVGRPMLHKNLVRLIEAFSKLKVEHPELLLVLSGKTDANYQRIERLVKKQAIKDIVFTDHISEGCLRWLYENCKAYVFPSLSEGFGLPGLEAMAHSAPVVSSNATCLPEIYGEAAYYFNPLDTQAMAKAINEVLSNKELRKDLIEKGFLQVSKYSWQKTAKQTLDVYKQVLAN